MKTYSIDELIFMLEGNDENAKKNASIFLAQNPDSRALEALKISLIGCSLETAYFIRRAISKSRGASEPEQKNDVASAREITPAKTGKIRFEFLISLQNWMFYYDLLEQKYIELGIVAIQQYKKGKFKHYQLSDVLSDALSSNEYESSHNLKLRRAGVSVWEFYKTHPASLPELEKFCLQLERMKEKLAVKKIYIANNFFQHLESCLFGVKIQSNEDIFSFATARKIIHRGACEFKNFIIKRIAKEREKDRLSVFLFLAESLNTEQCKKAVIPHLISPHPIIRFQALKCIRNFSDRESCRAVALMLDDSEKSIRDYATKIIRHKMSRFIEPVIVEMAASENEWEQQAAVSVIKTLKFNDKNVLKALLVDIDETSFFFKAMTELTPDIIPKKSQIIKIEDKDRAFRLLSEQIMTMSYPKAILAVEEFRKKAKKEDLQKVDDLLIFYKNEKSREDSELPDNKDIFLHPAHWLSHPSYKIRMHTAQALSEDRYNNWTKAMIKQLEQEDHPFVISFLTKTVGRIAKNDVIPVLSKYLRHEDPRVRANTIEGMFHITSPAVLPLVKPMVSDENSRVKITAVQLIATFDNKIASDVLLEMLFSKKDENISCAFFALRNLRLKEFIHIFKRIASLGSQKLKSEAFQFLSSVKEKYNFVNDLIMDFPQEYHVLNDEDISADHYVSLCSSLDPKQRFSALKILSGLADPVINAVIPPLLGDSDQAVRMLAEKVDSKVRAESEYFFHLYDIGKYIFSNAGQFINNYSVADIIKNSRDLFFVSDSRVTSGSFKSKQMYQWIGERIYEISNRSEIKDTTVKKSLQAAVHADSRRGSIAREIAKSEYPVLV